MIIKNIKSKRFVYGLIPAIGLAGLLGANLASAHGFFGGGGASALTHDEIASRQDAMFKNKAQLLGLSLDEVKNGWAEGKSFQQLAQAKGISSDELKTRLKDAQVQQWKTQFKALVDKGIITQAQADKRLQSMQARAENIGKHGRMGMGMGMKSHGLGF